MTYSQENQTFNLYSEDLNLIGIREYTLIARLEDYPTTTSDLMVGQIEVIDPCNEPGSITVTPQRPLIPYYYTGEIINYQMNPFLTWPPNCDFTYECADVVGPDPDVQCFIPSPQLGGRDVGKWTQETHRLTGMSTGSYAFGTIDMQTFSPGMYNFTIVATTGKETPISAEMMFTLDLRDPCPISQLQLLENPLTDIYYLVGEDEVQKKFNLSKMLQLNTPVNCGEFYADIKQVYDRSHGAIDQKHFGLV